SPLAQLEKAEANSKQQTLLDRWRNDKPVLCIPGPSLLGEAAAMMVAHSVEQKGIGARAEKSDALSMSRLLSWETNGVELACICYVAPTTPAQIRYAIRRLRRRLPDAAILVALFGNTEPVEDDEIMATAEIVQQSVCAAVDQVMAILLKRASSKPLAEKS